MTPAATAWSCDARHLDRPVGSAVGEDLTDALGGAVAIAAERIPVAVGACVAVMVAGAPHDTSIAARAKRNTRRR